MGNGSDHFVWNAGDGNDVVEGGAGADSMRFSASNDAEVIEIAANGERTRIVRDVDNVTLDLNDMESLA